MLLISPPLAGRGIALPLIDEVGLEAIDLEPGSRHIVVIFKEYLLKCTRKGGQGEGSSGGERLAEVRGKEIEEFCKRVPTNPKSRE